MSGHSKWHNIKRKKEANDSARSKVFSKMNRLLTVAVKKGGPDVDANPALRLAVDKAKQARMPKDTIDKAISKAAGGGDGTNFEEVIYEGYGPGGVAYLIYALTDNNNRTVNEIKMLFSKSNGSLGTPGSTSYIFDAETKEPMYVTEISDKVIEQNVTLIENLEDHDDIQEIYNNLP